VVVLKKIKASSLMETLVATVLIVVVFMLSSMILNTVFLTSIKKDTQAVRVFLNEVKYRYIQNKIQAPYYESYGTWEVSVEEESEKNTKQVYIEAMNLETQKTVSLKFKGID